ncbi:MAG: hypothetical protein HYX92_15225 [Chloroflexi bacterium]|nr:hypothetical protein [Chloroflexota bacterium]
MLGIPALPFAMPTHPIGGLEREAVWAKADSVIDDIVHVLTAPREKLAKEFRGRYPEPKGTFRPKPIFA